LMRPSICSLAVMVASKLHKTWGCATFAVTFRAMVLVSVATSYRSVKSAIERTNCNGNDNGCLNLVLGDGDCDRDSDCKPGLKCGENNCGDFRPSEGWPYSSGGGWDLTDDCCYYVPCDGQDRGCQHLALGDGDCDHDNDCNPGLKCGENNCGDFRSSEGWPYSSGGGWDLTDDCCYKPCDGQDSGCQDLVLGDGDCDRDSDCKPGLKCGENNCGDFRSSEGWPYSSGGGWDLTDDCCYAP